jgi:hypothetical protein
MSVVRIIFWVWLIVSVALLIQRHMRRRASPPSGAGIEHGGSAPIEDHSFDDGARRIVGSGDGLPAVVPAEPVDAATEAASRDSEPVTTDLDHDAASGLARIGERSELYPCGPGPERPVAAGDKSGEQAPGGADTVAYPLAPSASVEPAGESTRTAPTTTGPATNARALDIADALTGIHMPCDLAPLTSGATDLDPARVTLATSLVGSADLATQLDDELSRLGYEVTDMGGGDHVARRGETVVRVKVHDHPAVSARADGRGFPTAPPEGIVVEFTLG